MVDIALGVYLCMAFTAFNKFDDKGRRCTKVNIQITDSKTDGFIGSDEIKARLKKQGLFPLGKPITQIRTRQIEESLMASPFVKTAECYITQDGQVNIAYSQLMPIVRVKASNGTDYYIDDKCSIMPNYTFVLKKFSFGEILIGDVTISGVPCVEKDGKQTFTVEKDATITNGAEIAEMLGNKVHVTMNAEIEDGKLYAEMALPVTLGEETINVKATFGKKAANVEKTTYKDQLVISLNGDVQNPEEATIDVIKQSEGKYTFVLNQFSFGGLLIGDVTITDVPGVEKNGYVFYTVEKDAVITNGAEIAEALGNKVHVKIVEAYSKDVSGVH